MPAIQTTTYKTTTTNVVEPKYEGGYPLASEFYTYYPTWFNGKPMSQVGQTMTTTTTTIPTTTTTITGEPIVTGGQFEDVIVGGVSGRFPESDNVEEFAQNLYNGVDMVTEGERRWPSGLYGLPKRNGTIKDISRFDAQFFGIHPKQVDNMDPQLRILLEVAYESIFDAGFNPTELRGTRTGVFIGASGSEALHAFSSDAEQLSGYSMTGCATSMLANRLSYFFDFKGPSYAIDTACSSSLVALDAAINALKSGQCDYAIVGGVNILAKPQTSLQFQRLGMLSQDGCCKSFDANGKGYVRSETVGAIFLQKKSACRRFYAKILHSKINTDGAKEQGITFPSGEMQARLLREIYAESDIDPALVTYVEAHGTGTKAGDPQELNTIADIFAGQRVQRSVPLFIGSTKSNMGHPEPASGIAALVKMLISIQRGVIPANLHYQEPNKEVAALLDGRLKVVNEHTRFRGGLMALNSFGFGGANAHILLQPNSEYIMGRLGAKSFWNQDISEYTTMPRLFPFCARTQEGLEEIFQHVHQNKHDLAAQFLMQPNSTWPVSTHPYRGYTIINGQQQVQEIRQVVPTTTTTGTTVGQKPVWFVFSGMGTQWHGMGQELMKVDTFRQSIIKSSEYLKPYGLNLWEVIHSKVPTVYERTLNSFVGIAAIQIALVDCLRHAGVVPEGIVGHSVGELGCAYADGCFTHEETILAAYYRGRCIEEAKLPPGAMAAVGLTWEECQRRCPSGVVPACHNSHETVTISGPKSEVFEFVEQLTREGIFAKLVETNDVAFHSYFMNSIAMKLKQALDTVIRTPRQRTARWISTSIPESRWETELARFSSPEYHVNNLCSPVLFQEALKFVPTNAVVVEIAPHALLQAVLRRSLTPTVTLVPLMKKDVVHHLEHFLTQFGRMYVEGINVDAVKLLVPYGREHTIYPVPHTTGFISHLVKWDHQQQWTVPSYKNFTMSPTTVGGDEFTGTGLNVYKYTIDVTSALEDAYLTGHQIDGRIIYPATGYLHLVWKTFAKMNGYHVVEKFPVGFENVEIHRATILAVRDQKQSTMVQPKKIVFGVSITPNNGFFEVIESGSVVVTGRVFMPEQPIMNFGETTPCQWGDRQRTDLMVQEEIYRELRLRGYEYQHEFQPIIKADIEGSTGELIWNGKWISFMDGMLQMSVLGQKRGLLLPTRIRSIRIDPIQHFKTLVKPFRVEDYGMKTVNKYWCEQGRQFVPTTTTMTTTTTPFIVEEGVQVPVQQQQHYVVPVVFDPFTNTTVAGGIEIVGLHATSAPRRQFFQPTVVERVNFVPYVEKHFDDDYLFVDTYEKENGEHEPIIIQNVEEPTVKQQREFYDFYLNECKRYVQFIVKKLEHHTVQWTGVQPTGFVTIQPTQVPVTFQPFVEIMKNGGKLLSLLQQIATIECETGMPVTTYFYKVQKVFTEGHAYWNALEQDLVLNYLNKRSYYLKSFLDTVLENVNTVDFAKQPRLKVLEISPSFTNFMGVKVNNFIKTHPQLSSMDYFYAPTIMGQVDFMGQQQPEDFFTQINQQVPFPIQRVDWNFGIRQPTGVHNATKVVITEPPTHLKDFDLVIFNGALSTLLPHFEGEHEMKMWLKTVAERIMKPSGFMFVHEYTNSFDIVNSLNYLEQIVFRQQQVMPSVTGIHNQIFPVYKYQTEPQWCKMIEDAGFYPVALKSDSALSTMILYRVPSLYQTMKAIYPVMQTGTVTPTVFEEKILIDDMDQYTWVEKVKCAMANRQLERIWLISEKQPNSGIVGLVNCLRREIGGDRIRCIFIADKKPIICSGQFIPSFYEHHHTGVTTKTTHVVQWTQMFDRIRKADLIMNVFRNGKWGSYRHVFDGPQIEQHIFENERSLYENVFPQHYFKPTTVVPGFQTCGTPLNNAYINLLNRGDLSTLSWLQSPEPVLTGETGTTNGKVVCQVSYGALNFRDIMLATGKLTPEAIPGYWKMQDGLLGMEFSGIARDNRQKRFMGMVPAKGLATTVVVDPRYVWEVPREWTLEQAATVPVAYSTAYYALVVRGGLRRGDSVLIHAGSGAVGQAAIGIALSYDCEVFVTVSSNEKRDFLKSIFPGKLTDECFANSRDIFFEKHVMQMTQGRGVDVVLNSLAEDKLQASVRVLAQHGRFLEIGKFDLNKNSQLGMSVFLKNVSFHGILVDSLFETENHGDWKLVYQLVEEGIRTGVVRPLNSTVFERHQIEDAFRFMAQGKHIGKVLVKVWEPTEFLGTEQQHQMPTVNGYPRVWFSPMKTYIVTGGLGGFGLELTQWIVERGARRVILTSRSGVRTGYQARKLRTLQEEFGCQIQVSSFDVKEEGECILLIKEAIQMSPEKKIGGIFHLAAILEDGIFENQTADRFKRVSDVKYLGSYNLDKYTRSLEGCMDDSAYFVVFSSVSCGRGNAGQTNYGYANSAMERICEYRRRDGKHALAIQWGAIGDVGLIAENDIVVGGTVPQRIVSCLKTLEHLMLKSTETMRDTAIWSTFVPAERIAVQPITGQLINTPTKNLVEIIANIIGIKDVRQIRNEQMTLGELGLDSLMGVEIKQVLEQMYNMQLTVRDVQQLTFEKLRIIQQQTTTTMTTTTVPTTVGGGIFAGEPVVNQYKQTTMTTTTTGVYGQTGVTTAKKFNYLMPTRIVERLNAVEFGQQQVPVVVIHPIEGHVNMLKSWAKHMKYPVFGVQYTEDAMKCETIEQLADFYWQHIEKELLVQTPRVHLCGYSFGSSVAFEMAAKRANRVASLCLLDGSHSYVTAHVNTYKNKYQLEKLNETEAEALFTFAQQYAPIMSRVQFIDELLSLPTFDHRVKYTVQQLLTKSQFQFEPIDLEQSARSFVKKLFMSYKYQPMQPLRLNEILLIKSGQRSSLVQNSLGEDYGLGQVYNGKIKVQVVDGDHRSFLEANNGFQVASILNEYLLCCF